MVDRTRASVIAELCQRKRKQIEDKRKELELLKQEFRMLTDLAKMEENRLDFDDRERSVAWTGGAMGFRKSGKAQYRALKEIYKAGLTRITHADLASKVYGDPIEDVKNVTYWLARKMESHKCPFKLEHDNTHYWLESVEHY